MDHASTSGLWSSGRRMGRWDAGTLLGLHHTSTCVSRLGFHGNTAVHGHSLSTVEANVSAVGPGRAKCRSSRHR
jgi:hypothetical protein